jgi:class 3 adenylate cyclase
MEQHIRFCTTSDGVRIAYATVGQGQPLVRVLGWFTHLEFDWQMLGPELEASAWKGLFVRYDGRGMGLSDRDVQDFSLDAQVRDLEAVIDALKLRRCALEAFSEGGPTAIAYAVRHPERVSRLILYGSYARVPLAETEEGREQIALLGKLISGGWGNDVPASRQFFTALFMPDADGDSIRYFNELQRVSTSARNAAAFWAEIARLDVRDLLPRVKAPTLVIHRRGDAIVSFEQGRELAALIPGARFLPLEGRNHSMLPYEPEYTQSDRAMAEFLAEDRRPAGRRSSKAIGPSGPVTVLFTDVEGSTSLTHRLGDARAREALRTHEHIVRDALRSCGGSEIKTMGDGFMASFSSATRALECAIAVQRAMAEHNETALEPILVRIGLNAGEPIAEEKDLFGTAVNLAARVAAKAAGGEILVSDVVRQLVAGKGFLFSDRGDVALRGFEDPVRLYEVRWQDSGL